jgi:hypothetical protein
MGESFSLSKAHLDHMREESRLRDALAGRPPPREFPATPRSTGNPQYDWARECVLAGRPITILTPTEIAARMPAPQVPTEFSPDAKAKPFDNAAAFLAYEIGAKPARVADLKAKAKKHGISWTSCRRAKSHIGISTVERDGEHYWALSAAVAP